MNRLMEIFTDENDLKRYYGYLFHYTDVNGLLGILKTNKLWASDTFFMNDSLEVKYGLNLTRVIIEKKIKMAKEEWIMKFLSNLLSYIELSPETQIFAACFCQNGDLLSQWRGYSLNGFGYSLGFDSKELLRDKIKYSRIKIRKVIYQESVQTAYISSEIDNYIDKMKSDDNKDDDNYIISQGTTLALILEEFFLRFKSHFFSEEKEWRAIYSINEISLSAYNSLKINFRVSNNNLIPYVELPLFSKKDNPKELLPIKKIIIGPKNDFDKAKYSILKIIKNLELPQIEIIKSNVSLK